MRPAESSAITVLAAGYARSASSADGDELIDDLPPTLPLGVATVAAAGSTQGRRGGAGRTRQRRDGSRWHQGRHLPAAIAGIQVDVYSSVATNGLKIYPASGDDINDGTADASITIEGKTLARLVAVDDFDLGRSIHGQHLRPTDNHRE